MSFGVNREHAEEFGDKGDVLQRVCTASKAQQRVALVLQATWERGLTDCYCETRLKRGLAFHCL